MVKWTINSNKLNLIVDNKLFGYIVERKGKYIVYGSDNKQVCKLASFDSAKWMLGELAHQVSGAA